MLFVTDRWSSSTTTRAPRPSITYSPLPSPRRTPTEPACRRCYRRVLRYLPRVGCASTPQIPARQSQRFRGGGSVGIDEAPHDGDDGVRKRTTSATNLLRFFSRRSMSLTRSLDRVTVTRSMPAISYPQYDHTLGAPRPHSSSCLE